MIGFSISDNFIHHFKTNPNNSKAFLMSNYRLSRMKQEGSMISFRNDYLFSDDLLPVQKHQAHEEILQIEKEFASIIYYQRCKERDL
ncbi:hypothetical protein LCGC14_0471610 [marine sediment metagenome]|uniref:Uncharacterized protein n=1 Tax=marine sediment metagenome TaxID=412755 RepID=A0A0F9SHA6_9ZZZZ|nr:MAG: hypothetical protein Lokiarch_25400 [Candidatus Lokiarchaeum sp. GC14_75]